MGSPMEHRSRDQLALLWNRWRGRGPLPTAVIVVAVIAVACVVGWLALRGPAALPEDRLPRARPDRPVGTVASPTPAPIHVHVAGEARHPGLYLLPAGSRVADAVEAAGGPAPSGRPDRLNLAALLRDGDRVEIPNAHASPSMGGGGGEIGAAGGAGGAELVDINRAGIDDLESLPGIGPALAAAIVSYREDRGPFSSPDGLLDVPGIGPATLERLRPLVRA